MVPLSAKLREALTEWQNERPAQPKDRVLVLRDRRIAEEMTAPNIDQDRLLAACLTAA